MEATKSTAPPWPEEVYVLQDVAGQPQVRFTGTHLAYVSTGEHKTLPRWLTLDLYRKADGAYILHRIGYSVMYHDVKGCTGGEKMTLAELLEVTSEGSPCPECHPQPFESIKHAVENNPKTTAMVSLERNYYKVIAAADVPALVRELQFVPRHSTTGQRIISRPGQDLLMRAADHDEAIRSTFNAVKDI